MDVFPTRRDEHIHMIAVRGEIDLATAGDLLLRLRALAEPVSGPILLDLSQITFINFAGLRTLRAFDQHVTTAGGSVHVAAVSLPVARLFELVALHQDDANVADPPPLDAMPPSAAGRETPGVCAIAGV
ncbi:STAS domain-containing protein [Actinocrinis sp.]|uniref:STAS domain-containing protein n=1 Tax=Actinocrinis sp. TaxID=1920516 RepID=UPI002D31A7D9|nr:STAS domain-containing protein [Actinocrinis sp.]HZP52696.1 STAS domain-containing protein [Actinocrinis sp.]